MSDLTATNCGCNNGCNNGFGGCESIIWLIILLSCCGGNGWGNFGSGCGCGDNNGCNNILWILILLCCCGGNNCGC